MTSGFRPKGGVGWNSANSRSRSFGMINYQMQEH